MLPVQSLPFDDEGRAWEPMDAGLLEHISLLAQPHRVGEKMHQHVECLLERSLSRRERCLADDLRDLTL